MDTGEYSPDAHEHDWEHVRAGIIVRTDSGALVRYGSMMNSEVLDVDRTCVSEGPP